MEEQYEIPDDIAHMAEALIHVERLSQSKRTKQYQKAFYGKIFSCETF